MWIGVTAQRAQYQLPLSGFNIAAGHVGILSLQSIAHRGDGNLVSRQSLSIDPDIDRPIEAADNIDRAHAAGAFKLHLDHFIGVLSQLAHRALARQSDRQDRSGIVIELGNYRWLGVGRQVANDRADAVANVLRRRLDIAVQQKSRDHDRVSLNRNRAQAVDSVHGVDDFFDGL